MAEVLLRVVDVVFPGDPEATARASQRGDVIVVQADGWNWGRDERAAPFWRILKLPSLSVSEASVLLAPERKADPLASSRTLRRKAFAFDVDSPQLPAPLQAYLADATRAEPIFTFDVPAAQVQQFIVRKPPID